MPHGGESEALRGISLSGLAPFGGERRLAQICENNEDKERAWPECPDEIREALTKTRYVRMVLATPALFTHGWKPGWEELGGVRLTLKAAAVGRRVALSGWDFQKRGPKAVRWMVPAGSVFYFEVPDNNAPLLADQWLAPVSDDEQDRRDGYGLALWGVWNPS